MCVCGGGNFKSQAASSNQSSWLLGPSSAWEVWRRTLKRWVVPACLSEHPIVWSVSEPICYTQIAHKKPNLLGHWEQHSCIGIASCSNTALFQGGSLGTSTWHNTGYKQVCNFRVRALEKTQYAHILYVGLKKKINLSNKANLIKVCWKGFSQACTALHDNQYGVLLRILAALDNVWTMLGRSLSSSFLHSTLESTGNKHQWQPTNQGEDLKEISRTLQNYIIMPA